MKQYRVTIEADDPVMTLTLPVNILKDIVLRSEENGTSIESEITCRLARSLERDFEMIEEDNQLAYAAFERFNEANVK